MSGRRVVCVSGKKRAGGSPARFGLRRAESVAVTGRIGWRWVSAPRDAIAVDLAQGPGPDVGAPVGGGGVVFRDDLPQRPVRAADWTPSVKGLPRGERCAGHETQPMPAGRAGGVAEQKPVRSEGLGPGACVAASMCLASVARCPRRQRRSAVPTGRYEQWSWTKPHVPSTCPNSWERTHSGREGSAG